MPEHDSRRFVVTVDFSAGEVYGFTPLAESLVEFIQEDRVTADDDLAMVMADYLASYLQHGELTDAEVKLLQMAIQAVLS